MSITLKQALKLKSLGVNRYSEKCWYDIQRENPRVVMTVDLVGFNGLQDNIAYAYTVEELVELCEGDYTIAVCDDKSVRIVPHYEAIDFTGVTLAEAMCEMLIHYTKKKIIEKVNE